jgi:NCAIR mutase (PurE)-related protein
MDRKSVEDLLRSVAQGSLSVAAASERLAVLPYQDLGFAKPDMHRSLRQGYPEVIFCPGKTASQIAQIASKLRSAHSVVIATRCEADVAEAAMAEFRLRQKGAPRAGDNGKPVAEPANATAADSTLETALDTALETAPQSLELEKSVHASAATTAKNAAEICEYLAQPKAIIFGELPPTRKLAPSVSIITAGTSDIAVAEEVALIVVAAGYPVSCVYDVGVAGVQRLFDSLTLLREAQVTVVVAGMDGALASFVGGLLEKPVIAVPTSIGYGSSFGGVAALLSMLNSCAAGLTVVNIDNGFGAAMAALRILSCHESSKN